MGNVNISSTRLYTPSAPIEPALIVGTGETYADVASVPEMLKYAGKRIFDKDTGKFYNIGADGLTATEELMLTSSERSKIAATSGTNTGDQDLSGKANIIGASFTGIHVLTQAEYDALDPKVATVIYLIKEVQS